MINGMYRGTGKYNGKNVIIDLAEVDWWDTKYGRTKYEVIVMCKSSGAEIELKRFAEDEFDEAVKTYNEYLEKYKGRQPQEPKPLTGRYAKLRNDLIDADASGCAAASTVEDGGTCNFDSVMLYLPRWKKSLVMQAAYEAGIGCREHYGAFIFGTSSNGQGYRRTTAAEKMKSFLSGLHYDTSMYYQID